MFGSMFEFQGRVGIELDTACPSPPGKIGVSDFTELDDFTSSVCRPSSKGNFELDCQPCSINGLGARFNQSSFRENRARYSEFDCGSSTRWMSSSMTPYRGQLPGNKN